MMRKVSMLSHVGLAVGLLALSAPTGRAGLLTTTTRHLTNKDVEVDIHSGDGEKHGPEKYGMYGSDLQGYGDDHDEFIDGDHEREGPGPHRAQPSVEDGEHMKGAGGEEQKGGEGGHMKGEGSKDKEGKDMKGSTVDKPMKADEGAHKAGGKGEEGMKGGKSEGDIDGEKQDTPRPRSSGASDEKPGEAASDDSGSDKDGPGSKLDASGDDKPGGEKYAGDDEIEAPGPAPRLRSRRALFAADSNDSTHAHEHNGDDKTANGHDHDDDIVGQAPRAVPRAQGTRGEEDHDSDAPGPAPRRRGAACGGNRNGTNSDEGQGMRDGMGAMGGMVMAPRAAPNSRGGPQSANSTDVESDDIMCDDMEEMGDMAPRAGPRTQATNDTAKGGNGMKSGGDGMNGSASGIQAPLGAPGSPNPTSNPRRALAGHGSYENSNADSGGKKNDSMHSAHEAPRRTPDGTTSDETAKGDGLKGSVDGEDKAEAPRRARPPLDGAVKYKAEDE